MGEGPREAAWPPRETLGHSHALGPAAPFILEEGLTPPAFPLYKGCPRRRGEHTVEPFPLFGGALLSLPAQTLSPP